MSLWMSQLQLQYKAMLPNRLVLYSVTVTAPPHDSMTPKLLKNNFLLLNRSVFKRLVTLSCMSNKSLLLWESFCVWDGEWKHVCLPHLSLQHVSSRDAWRPLLCAVGAADRQTVSLTLLLRMTDGRGRAAAASSLHRHPAYLSGGPAPCSSYLRRR